MDEQKARVKAELASIASILTQLTGLPSRWNGELELVPEAFKGKKRFSCGIEISTEIVAQESRWSTLIHEILHSLSTGYTASAYWDLPGWEEGVVEQLQRQYRSAVLDALEVSVDADVFLITDAEHRYNRYIAALEAMCLFLNIEVVSFYLALLRTPIRERPGYVLNLSKSLGSVDRREYLHIFSASNAVLKEALEQGL